VYDDEVPIGSLGFFLLDDCPVQSRFNHKITNQIEIVAIDSLDQNPEGDVMEFGMSFL
jgi:hypothetical protein